MTKLRITRTGNALREMSIEEAVTEAIDLEAYYGTPDGAGIIEKMRAKIEQQNHMLGRLLAVIAEDYGDHYTSPEFEPKDTAGKLGFILGPHMKVSEV